VLAKSFRPRDGSEPRLQGLEQMDVKDRNGLRVALRRSGSRNRFPWCTSCGLDCLPLAQPGFQGSSTAAVTASVKRSLRQVLAQSERFVCAVNGGVAA